MYMRIDVRRPPPRPALGLGTYAAVRPGAQAMARLEEPGGRRPPQERRGEGTPVFKPSRLGPALAHGAPAPTPRQALARASPATRHPGPSPGPTRHPSARFG